MNTEIAGKYHSLMPIDRCICKRGYEGQSCEKRLEFDDKIETIIAELRKTFNVVNGVPTAVDVFFSIRSLSQKLSAFLKNIKASFAYTNSLIQHSEIIYQVENVADLYGKLQSNELTFDQFGERIDNYLHTVTAFDLENRLKDDSCSRYFRPTWEWYLSFV